MIPEEIKLLFIWFEWMVFTGIRFKSDGEWRLFFLGVCGISCMHQWDIPAFRSRYLIVELSGALNSVY